MKRQSPRTLGRCCILFALAAACASSKPAPKPLDPLQGLEDCPRSHEVALRGEDITHINDLLANAEQSARADRGRCAPAKRECVTSCAAYTARCPKPYVSMDGSVPNEQTSPSDFCDEACAGDAPYLKLARFFDGTSCRLSAWTGSAEPVAE